MSDLEQKSKQRRRRKDLQRYVLSAVALSGGLVIAAVAPNVLQLLGRHRLSSVPRQGELVVRARKRLIEKGLLKSEGGYVRITEKGERKLLELEGMRYQVSKTKKWDGRWRMLIFDIPEKRKSLRNRIRETLMGVGFIKVQDSVWLYPFDCEEFVVLLKADFRIGKDLLYAIVDSLEGDHFFRSHFGLPAD